MTTEKEPVRSAIFCGIFIAILKFAYATKCHTVGRSHFGLCLEGNIFSNRGRSLRLCMRHTILPGRQHI